MVRRGKFETPKIVERNAKRKGAGRLIRGIQRLLQFRETIVLKRLKQLWLKDKDFFLSESVYDDVDS